MSVTHALRRTASRTWRKTGGAVKRSYRRRQFVSSIRPTDVFIVTYPKSGTTWLRFMVANVIHSAPEAVNLKNQEEVVPDINQTYFSRTPLHAYSSLPDPRFFVLHAPYDPALRRTIYIMRDPRDTMVSYYHHHRLTVPNRNRTLIEFLQGQKQWPCSWEEHVRGWFRHRSDPGILIIRYEEMHRDKEGVLRRVLDFSGVKYTDAHIERAHANSDIKRMRALEESFGMTKVAPVGNEERFVRKGKPGGWREELNPEEQEVLQRVYGPLAGEFGFAEVRGDR
jgi:hypothetical protein